jgi:transcription regulator|nr:MAG TPA: helix-turn-helix domain protein [Caudoviricetes sp.]
MSEKKFKFGNRLKELRKPLNYPEKHFSMDELCEKFSKKYGLRVNKSMMSRWENGTAVPDNKHIVAYADYFDVDMNYLIGLTNVKRKLSDFKLDKILDDKRAISDIIKILEKLDNEKLELLKDIISNLSKSDNNKIEAIKNLLNV